MHQKGLVFLSSLSFLLIPMAARADQFTISGANTVTFNLPATPVISSDNPGLGFTVSNISVMVNGTKQTEDILFFEQGIAIAPTLPTITRINPFEFDISAPNAVLEDYTVDPTSIFLSGLFTYTPNGEAHPTFITGSYGLENYNFGNLEGTLTITADATPAVTPEPSSFALLGTGLIALAGVVRKRFA